MNENMTNASERETLVATNDTAGERYKEMCRMALAHEKKTMEEWIERLGLGGKFQVARVNLNYGMTVTTHTSPPRCRVSGFSRSVGQPRLSVPNAAQRRLCATQRGVPISLLMRFCQKVEANRPNSV